MVKSGLISGGHIQPRGYENMAGFWPGTGPDMISSSTLDLTHIIHSLLYYALG